MTKQEYEATIAELRERHEAFVRIIREQAGDERFTDAYSINRIIALCDAHAPEPPAFLRRQTTDYECAISMLAAQTVAKSKLLGENLVLKARIADLEARLATAEGEVVRLNQWADGMTDIALKERATGEAYQRELRDKLADCQAVIRHKGHDADCWAERCVICGNPPSSITNHYFGPLPSHNFQPGPCSDACGHDRVVGHD